MEYKNSTMYNSIAIQDYINTKYKIEIKIYTDGSKSISNKVAAAVYIPEKTVLMQIKLPDQVLLIQQRE